MEVTLHQAQKQLPELIAKVARGEEVMIAAEDRLMIQLVVVSQPVRVPILGSARGQVIFHEGWEAPLNDAEYQEFLGE